jgi:hypothetical protein
MQSRNSEDYFLRRLETHGKLGKKKQISISILGDFIHLILYVVTKLFNHIILSIFVDPR